MVLQPQSRHWTYEDLLALPDDGKRREIIAGVLYEMPSINSEHALIVMRLIQKIFGPLMEGANIQLFTAPLDVFICDDSLVQPDLVILLPEQRSMIARRGIEGPPALLVEVFSPGNAAHDRNTKRDLYARAGVGEYWLVSPEAMLIQILTLEGDHYVVHSRVGGDEPLISPTLPTLTGSAAQVFENIGTLLCYAPGTS